MSSTPSPDPSVMLAPQSAELLRIRSGCVFGKPTLGARGGTLAVPLANGRTAQALSAVLD